MGSVAIRCNTVGRGGDAATGRPSRCPVREVAILDHVVSVRARADLQLCGIHIYRSGAVARQLDLHGNGGDSARNRKRDRPARPFRANRPGSRYGIRGRQYIASVQDLQFSSRLPAEICGKRIGFACRNGCGLRRIDHAACGTDHFQAVLPRVRICRGKGHIGRIASRPWVPAGTRRFKSVVLQQIEHRALHFGHGG